MGVKENPNNDNTESESPRVDQEVKAELDKFRRQLNGYKTAYIQQESRVRRVLDSSVKGATNDWVVTEMKKTNDRASTLGSIFERVMLILNESDAEQSVLDIWENKSKEFEDIHQSVCDSLQRADHEGLEARRRAHENDVSFDEETEPGGFEVGSQQMPLLPPPQRQPSEAYKDFVNTRRDEDDLFNYIDTSKMLPEERRDVMGWQTMHMKQLPHLKLGKFSGTADEDFDVWSTHFTKLVDSKGMIKTSTKMDYLMECLDGSAKKDIEAYTAGVRSEDSYKKACDMLNVLYGGDLRREAKSQMRFNKLKPMESMSPNEIKRVFIGVSQIVDFHKEHRNDYNLENPGSSDYRDARKKLGKYLQQFDEWVVEKEKQTCLNTLRVFLEIKHKAAQFTSTLDDSEDESETAFYFKRNEKEKSKERKPWKSDRDKKTSREFSCPTCSSKERHYLSECKSFKKMSSSERSEVIKKERRCFHCTGYGHISFNCTFRKGQRCGVNGCSAYHHPCLHENKATKKDFGGKERKPSGFRNKSSDKSHKVTEEVVESESASEEEETQEAAMAAKENSCPVRNGPRVAIQAGTVTVHCNGKSVDVNCLLDLGADNTNITEDLADFLKMERTGEPVKRKLSVMGGKTVSIESMRVKFEVSPKLVPKELVKRGITKETRFSVSGWTMPSVCGNTTVANWKLEKENFKHLKGLQIAAMPSRPKIDLVIGTDFPGLLCVLDSRSSSKLSDPVAHLVRLGWFVFGPADSSHKGKSYSAVNEVEHCYHMREHCFSANENRETSDSEMKALAGKFWELHEGSPELQPFTSRPRRTTIEAKSSSRHGTTKEAVAQGTFKARDRKYPVKELQDAYDKMQISYDPKDSRYTAKIPWKDDSNIPKLRNNREQVLQRQAHTLSDRYLDKKGVTLLELQNVIDSYLSKNYIRELSEADLREESWYLPTFPVVDRSRATTKVRLVFDAAAKFRGKSLNSEQLTGPNLMLNFLQPLFRFRRYRYAFSADIGEMFLRIHLDKSDQCFHRFVFKHPERGWLDYEWQRAIFGGTSIPNVSQKVLHCIVEDSGKKYSEASDVLINSTYVDDTADSREEEKVAVQTLSELKELLSTANMVPRKVLSNSKVVLQSVPKDDRAREVELTNSGMNLNDGKLLGVYWSPTTDHFFVKASAIPGGKSSHRKVKKDSDGAIVWNKRQILSVLFKVFDPLGLLAPFTIRGKILLQRLCMNNLSWDEPIPWEYEQVWLEWLSCLENVNLVKLERHLGLSSKTDYQIHCFCDASLESYACVFYMRTELFGKVKVVFLFAKARVTPLKALSVARLELMACQLGAETSVTVKQYLNLHKKIHFWTDSRDCLFWLNQPSKIYKPFVANRSGIVQALTDILYWRHVSSQDNSADHATRGLTIEELAGCELWLHGPPWLSQNEKNWPPKFVVKEHVAENIVKDEYRAGFSFKCVQQTEFVSRFLNPERHSVGVVTDGWKNLVKRATIILKCLKLTPNERIEKAQQLLFKIAQWKSYEVEMEVLSRGEKLKSSNTLSKFSPFLDSNGVMRMKTRLEHSELLQDESKFKVILPSKSKITQLLVSHYHHKLRHPVGENALRAELSKRFLIPSFYYIERRLRKSCVTCVRKAAIPGEQQMAPFPEVRYNEPLKSFRKVGLDFAGPFYVKQKRTTRTNVERPKVYVLVITCLVTRGVHFEVTPDMTTDAVFRALSRFSDRRGVPELIYSDNQTSFVAADKILQELHSQLDFDQLELLTAHGYKRSSKGIQWIFNPPLASHHGGVFETIVKALKRSMHSVFGYADLTLDEFMTAVVNCEGLLNSRPLTFSDPSSPTASPLTPNHFLHGLCGGEFAPPSKAEPGKLCERWRHVNMIQNHFWQRWHAEVLPLLHPRKKWKDQKDNIKPGSLVIEIDPKIPKGIWKVAKVEKVLPSKDDQVRSVLIRSTKGVELYHRPITVLLPLEFQEP